MISNVLETLLAKALDFWISHQLQELLRPFLVLSSISAMFWMLAHLASFCVFVMKALLPEEVSALLSVLYSMVLAVVYAAMMFHTALLGQWHPSLLWREAAGFVFMYVMLGVTFTDQKTKHLYPYAKPAFFLGMGAYLFLAVVPALIRRPAFAEFHRVLELFAAWIRQRVAGAHALVQGRDQIEVLLSGPIVSQRCRLQGFADVVQGQDMCAFSATQLDRDLERVQKPAGIPIRTADERVTDGARHIDPRAAQPLLLIHQAAVEHGEQRVLSQGLQHHHPAATQEGRVHFEGWILRRGTEQNDQARLGVREQGILLCPVEAMDLIEEQDGALP